MKTNFLHTTRRVGILVLVLSFSVAGFATEYTANTSGDFSSPSTWFGGVVPPLVVMTDQIIIPVGINVNMDNSVEISGLLADLQVNGTLSSSNASALTLTLGSLSGSGMIMLTTVSVNATTVFAFTGSMTVGTLNAGAGFLSSADIVVDQTLNLVAGTLSLVTGGSIDMGLNGTIAVNGGLLALGTGGSAGLGTDYNVVYTGGSTLTGIELSGVGLQNVTIDVNVANEVTLTSDLVVEGVLAFTEGRLELSGNDLVVNGTIAASGNGTLSSTALSNIDLNSLNGTLGTITFTTSAHEVNNLTVNVGTGDHARIGGSLTIEGALQLNNGVLNFNDTDLKLQGTMTGTGQLSSNTASDLTINFPVGVNPTLAFVLGGQVIHDLNLTLGTGIAVVMGSDLFVEGNLELNSASNIDLNGNMFTLATASTVGGSGGFVADATATLVINATDGLAGLRVEGSIGQLTVNTISQSVTLATDLTVDGLLDLESGTLHLNNRDLTINGNINTVGVGLIASSSTSDISVNGSQSPDGALSFDGIANTVGVLSINLTNSSLLKIGTDLHVATTLEFLEGRINVVNHMLTLNGSATITGEGIDSYVVTSIDGSLECNITAGASTAVDFPIGTLSHYSPARISFAAGSTSGRANVGVVSGVMSNGMSGADLAITQPIVDATWNIGSSVSSNLDMNLQVLWTASMEVNSFNRNAAYIAHHINGDWDAVIETNSTVETGGYFSMERQGITSLSPFAVFDENTFTAITELDAALLFDIYPNPTSDNIVIRNTDVSGQAVNMEIYSANGQLVGTFQLTNIITTIAVNQLIPGDYTVLFHNASMKGSKSFVKM